MNNDDAFAPQPWIASNPETAVPIRFDQDGFTVFVEQRDFVSELFAPAEGRRKIKEC